MTLKIKTIEQPAIVVDQGVTTNLNAGDSYTCSEPEEKLDFILTIDTTISDVSPSDTIKLQFLSGNFLVNWGDGIEEYYDFTSQTRIEHQYTTGGVYDILFNGCGVIQNSSPNFSDRKKTIAVKQWGKFFSSALSNAFPNNTNISSFPQSETLSCFSGSYQSSFLNIPLSNFGKINTSCILNFSSMFYGSNFDYNIGGWNISKAKNFTDTFFQCQSPIVMLFF